MTPRQNHPAGPGISGMRLYVPELRVDLGDWCRWTGASWDKVRGVVGHSFRMPRPDESVYTMAATAALDLILAYDIDPREVGLLALGTESSTDNSAGAVILRGMLDAALDAMGRPRLSTACEVPEVKHACLGGIYALKSAVRYLATDGADRKAIVVCVDIAEYARGSSGEQTQGAGAVAMLLEPQARLLELDLRRSGSASSYRGPDFRKPARRHQIAGYAADVTRLHDFPVFNGKYSTWCYVDSTLRAVDDLFARIDRAGDASAGRSGFLGGLGAIFFHRPYHWMPVQALAAVYVQALARDAARGLDDGAFASLCDAAGVTPAQVAAELAQDVQLIAEDAPSMHADPAPALRAVARAARRHSPALKALLDERMRLGAGLMMDIGNLYTAALPAWLAAGFEDALSRDEALDGQQVLAIGYGSGDASEALLCRVCPGTWRAAAAKIGFSEALAGPVTLSQRGYEALHDTGSLPGEQTLREPDDAATRFVVARVGATMSAQLEDVGLEYYRFVG